MFVSLKIKRKVLRSYLARSAHLRQKRVHDSPLVRQGRLSVVPLNEEQFEWLTGR